MTEAKTGSCIIEAGIAFVGARPDGSAELRHDVAIRVHEGVIAQIGPLRGMIDGNEHLPRFGGKDTVAMPGLVNSHHHFGVTPLMAGIPFEPLEFWLPHFRAMRSVGPRLDTLYSAIEMLESGTTGVHHIASGLTGGSDNWEANADAVLAAYGEAGMRVGYSAMLRDQNILSYDGDQAVLDAMPEDARAWFEARLHPKGGSVRAYADFHRSLKRRYADNKRVRINYAPANLHWCSDDLLETIGAEARANEAQIHMHLVETKRQAVYARERFGCSAVRHLDDLGLLGAHVTLGHCNWLEGDDLSILGHCGCTVCHNASSGQRLGSGRADVAALSGHGVRVALGIDQSNIADDRDMLLEMKLAWALHRGTDLFTSRVEAPEVLRQATENGARSLGYGSVAGRLDCGLQADIVLLSRSKLERPYCDPATSIVDLILHRSRKDAIQHVFVDGNMVVRDGRVTLFDRDAVLEDIRLRLSQPWTTVETEAREMVHAALPAIRKAHERFS